MGRCNDGAGGIGGGARHGCCEGAGIEESFEGGDLGEDGGGCGADVEDVGLGGGGEGCEPSRNTTHKLHFNRRESSRVGDGCLYASRYASEFSGDA